MHPKVDSVRDQAVELMSNRGDHCRKVVEPKLTELNQRFAAISQRIKSEKVGRNAKLSLTGWVFFLLEGRFSKTEGSNRVGKFTVIKYKHGSRALSSQIGLRDIYSDTVLEENTPPPRFHWMVHTKMKS